jgi:hypothetical protein
MKKMYLVIIGLAFLLNGCGGSKYNYTVTPTPLKAKKTTYKLRTFNFTYAEGRYATPNNKEYMSEKQLKEYFKTKIIEHLKKNNIYSQKENNSFYIDINLEYIRNYYWGGVSLMKPHFKHTVKIFNSSNQEVAISTISYSEPKYAYFKEGIVSAQILAGLRRQGGEIEDINLITKLLVNDLAEAGK